MFKATVNGDTKSVEAILYDIHNLENSIFRYNDENSVACLIALTYLSAMD